MLTLCKVFVGFCLAVLVAENGWTTVSAHSPYPYPYHPPYYYTTTTTPYPYHPPYYYTTTPTPYPYHPPYYYTTTPTPYPYPYHTTTTPTPPCTCLADLVIILDTSGSIESSPEFDNVKDFVSDVIDELDPCLRSALIEYSTKANVVYGFTDAESTSATAVIAEVQGLGPTAGDTNTARALIRAREEFLNDPSPQVGGCPVVLIVTDGGSDKKDNTRDQTKALRDQTGARMCVVGTRDQDETIRQTLNRRLELNLLNSFSVADSELVGIVDFSASGPSASLVQDVVDCICKPCGP